ncbi:hypothetical protein JCM14469_12150 [Desulfatiferula olefinivorans]
MVKGFGAAFLDHIHMGIEYQGFGPGALPNADPQIAGTVHTGGHLVGGEETFKDQPPGGFIQAGPRGQGQPFDQIEKHPPVKIWCHGLTRL